MCDNQLIVSIPLGVYTNSPVSATAVLHKRLNTLGVLKQGMQSLIAVSIRILYSCIFTCMADRSIYVHFRLAGAHKRWVLSNQEQQLVLGKVERESESIHLFVFLSSMRGISHESFMFWGYLFYYVALILCRTGSPLFLRCRTF